MDFQVLKLVPKTDVQKETDQLDLFAGVRSGLDDPYNLFFRVSNIETESPQIYFYSYSLGKKKVVFWGIYDMDENNFLVDSACRYQPNNLKKMIDTWKSHAFEFYSAGVRDRVAPRAAREMAFENAKKEEGLFSEFKDHFMVNLVRGGHISIDTLPKTDKIAELLGFSNRVFTAEYQAIIDEVQKHATSARLDKAFSPLFETLLEEVETRDDEKLIRDSLEKEFVTPGLKENAFAYKLYRHMMVNYFISLFAGMEEYRIAKYIVFSDENRKEKGRFEPHIKGSFFYEWLVEMSKAFRSDDNRTFIVNYARTFVTFMEERLNMTNIGVIGAGVKKQNKTIDQISNFFTKFVSLSKYSKISIVNELEECPTEDVCENSDDEKCGLYEHGKSRQSKFDFT